MILEYKTIFGRAEGFYKEKGSKFYGYALPIKRESDIKAILDKLKEEHPKARHHCFAFRFGTDGNNFRANDDGEPSGTAGRPILGQIDSFGLLNVLVVVVRYFGGTLLGASGLIRSYRAGAFEALSAAKIVEEKVQSRFQINFKYPVMNQVMKRLKAENVNFINQRFELDCEVIVEVETRKEMALKESLRNVEALEIKRIGKG